MPAGTQVEQHGSPAHLNILVTLDKGTKCSVVAITVPLMEQEYILEEQCALFIHMHVSQVT